MLFRNIRSDRSFQISILSMFHSVIELLLVCIGFGIHIQVLSQSTFVSLKHGCAMMKIYF